MDPRRSLRLVVTVLGVAFLVQGIAWLIVPARTAAGLGMPLLDGMGRSTQIGDFAAFFLLAGGTMLAGNRPGRTALLRVPAALFTLAAGGRLLAWLLHGADFAALFIFVELATATLLFQRGRWGVTDITP